MSEACCIVPRRAESHWASELIRDGQPVTLSPGVQILIATNGELSVILIVLSKKRLACCDCEVSVHAQILLSYFVGAVISASNSSVSAVSSTCTPDMSAELSLVRIARAAANVDYVTSTVMKNSL